MRIRLSLILAISLVPSLALAICPSTTPEACEDDADIYYVKADCTDIDNCFESMSVLTGTTNGSLGGCDVLVNASLTNYGDLVDNVAVCQTRGWLWEVREPSSTSPVSIQVEAGTFGPFICPLGNGHVSVIGAGQASSTLRGSATQSVGVDAFQCDELYFSDIRVDGPRYGVRWFGGGSGTWNRVTMVADRDLSGATTIAAGWVDDCSPLTANYTRSEHFFRDSQSTVTGSASGITSGTHGYISNCAESYFFGGLISNTTEGSSGDGTTTNLGANGLTMQVGAVRTGVEESEFFGFEVVIVSNPTELTDPSLAVGVNNVAASSSSPRVLLTDSTVSVVAQKLSSGTGNVVAEATRESGGEITLVLTSANATVVNP